MEVRSQNNNQISGNSISKEQAVAFVVVRLSSSRLPGKQFRLIGDRSILQWIIDELQTCKELDQIVIATVAEKENEPLRDFAKDHDLPCFWYEGEVDHVTTRLRRAAEEFNADICVLVSGDCPLIHAASIDYLIKEIRGHPNADVLEVRVDDRGNLPALEGVAAARKRAWQRADDLSTRPELKKHQFPVIGQRPDMFKVHRCRFPKELYDPFHHRFSVDTYADLEFMNAIYNALCAVNRPFSLPEALDLLKQNPSLLEINRDVHQMGVGEERKKVLMVVDAGNGYGYGHLMRSRELALQITERLGWPVTLVADDEKAISLAMSKGISARWGALGRDSRPMSQKRLVKNLEDTSDFDVAILDIYWKRNLSPGWRDKLSVLRTVVLNRTEAWAREADAIIIPEICSSDLLSKSVEGGRDHIIIRREIRRARSVSHHKDIDILAYLYSVDQRDILRKIAGQNGMKVQIIDVFSDEFPSLLARSRFFVSGFGYSFYEALYLNAIPITMPLTSVHRAAAERFYRAFDIPALILDNHNIEGFIWPQIKIQASLEDGTKNIIREIHNLVSKGIPL